MVTVHVLLIIVTGLAVVYADGQGFEWFRGMQKTLSKKKLDILHAVVSLGLSGIILTGGFMFIDRPGLLEDSTFLTKMVFVAVLTVNGLLIGSLASIASTKEFKDVALAKKRLLLLSGSISLICWIGAVTCGLLL